MSDGDAVMTFLLLFSLTPAITVIMAALLLKGRNE